MSLFNRLIMLIFSVLYSLSSYVASAEEMTLSVDRLFELIDNNSKSIKSKQIAYEHSQSSVGVAKSEWLPSISASLSFSYLGNGYITDRDFSNGMNVDMPHYGNNFAIEATQAIYTGGAITNSIKLAELQSVLASLDVEKNRQEVRFLLLGYYLDLFKLENQRKVLVQNIDLTKSVLENMRSKYEQGTVLKNDITRYELQLSNLNLRLTKITDACNIYNYELVNMLGLDPSTRILPDSALLDSTPLLSTSSEWHSVSDFNNILLQQAKIGIKMSEHKEKLEYSERLPKIAVVAGDHFDGPILVEVPVINSNFNYWYVGVGVKYNISSLFKTNKKLKEAKLGILKSTQEYEVLQENLRNGVQASYINYVTSFSELKTNEKSVELANENYDIVSNRFQNDLALITDMVDAANMKLSAALDLENSKIAILYSYYKLKFITNTL
ncbi:MAG: TolC family protein [Muribaculaceae bacterium]|nr:TolC family protein [Muribaculaceae bacterium]